MPNQFERLRAIALAVSLVTACSPDGPTSPELLSRQPGRSVVVTFDSWQPVASIPLGRYGLSAAEAGGKIYTFGGSAFPNNCTRVDNAEVYDPATNAWETRAPMPAPRFAANAATVNGTIYLIGGENGCGVFLNTVLAYNTVTNTWSQRASAPEALYNSVSAAAVVDGIIYVGGGSAGARFYAYDPVANTWAQKASMPLPPGGNNHVSAAVGGKVYALWGVSGFEYNPATNTWAPKADAPFNQDLAAAAVAGGRIHIFGGGVALDGRVWVRHSAYDPATDRWTTEPNLPTGQVLAGAASVNGTIYAIAGLEPPANVVKHVRAFTPRPPNTPPAAHAGADHTLYRTSPTGAAVTLDGSGSTDAEGAIATYEWYEGVALLGSGTTLVHTFPLGIHAVKLVVTDAGGLQDDDEVLITVLNAAPTVSINPPVTLECTSNGAQARFAAKGTDIDGTISYLWSPTGATTSSTSFLSSLGTTNVSVTVTDDDGATAQAASSVTVVDRQAPQLTFAVSPTTLSPANRKMYQVASGLSVSDGCASRANLAVGVTVTSNEPVNGIGDGNTSSDWEVRAHPNGTYDVFVRAERAGSGTGRIYTITMIARDPSGNTSTRIGTVTVPRNQTDGL